MDKIAYLRGVRETARAHGDRGLERAVTADLTRLGHTDVSEPTRVETTSVQAPERAVPEAKQPRRAPRPRCEHGRIVGRCIDCQDDH